MYELDPWGERRADLRNAIGLKIKYGGKIDDFMPVFDKEPETPESIAYKARTVFSMFSPTVTKPSSRIVPGKSGKK